MPGPRISTEYTYKGVDTAFLENAKLRVKVLTGKGGDIVEFRDKRTDVDVLWGTHHNWTPPGDRYVPAVSDTTWVDHYPGGWQVNVPVAGHGWDIEGNGYGLHGESALIPWDATVRRDDSEAVTLGLSAELVRYPFSLERELTLPADESRLEITESITNLGGVELEYMWQQHVALGPPLLDPAARLDVPATSGRIDEYDDATPNVRLESDCEFEWPSAPARDGGTVDLREIPPKDAKVYDQAYATDLTDGWYALTNPELDLGFGLTFPTDPFECLWYWQALGGVEASPFFARNYNVGLEPTTAYPGWNIPEAQRENGTMKSLAPDETVTASFTAVTYEGYESVSAVRSDGTIRGVQGTSD